MTDRITYLEEGDYAFVTRAGREIYDATGRLRTARPRIRLDRPASKRPATSTSWPRKSPNSRSCWPTRCGIIVHGRRDQPARGLDFAGLDRLTLVACGTAHYACHAAKYWFETLAGLPCEVDVASEFRYREPPLPANSSALFVSQSGETADTLAALRYAKDKVAKIVSVVNVPTSSIARESDMALPILAGVEVGVASTKAFTCQLTVLALLALKAAHDRGRIDAAGLAAHLADLAALPGLMNLALARDDDDRRAGR